MPNVKKLPIDGDYLLNILYELLDVPSPSGFTDNIVQLVGNELGKLGVHTRLSRRGSIHAKLRGRQSSPNRALVAHLDTLGAMVKRLKNNGRLEIVPVGTWSSRFAEGARVTVITDDYTYRGTVLPLRASGHTYHRQVDELPVSWDNVEVRIDEFADGRADLEALGFNVGDTVAFDPGTEVLDNGFIFSRHLDDKAGVACMLAALKAVRDAGGTIQVPMDCHLVFTISEEVGSGASSAMHLDTTEMVSVDNATLAPGQNSSERGVTIAMMDSSGPFDYHLTRRLLALCRDHDIEHTRDIFRYYRCDAASAVLAGNDVRTVLVCFGVDASHGYERTHIDSLRALTELLALYMQSPPTFATDKRAMGPLKDFTTDQPIESTTEYLEA